LTAFQIAGFTEKPKFKKPSSKRSSAIFNGPV
jgi:hypothetical protein